MGEHTTRPYIADATLTSVNKKLASRPSFGKAQQPGAQLEYIAIVTSEADIDVRLLARKISALPDVDTADALPVQRITAIPNDPLFSKQYHLSLIKAPEAWDIVLATGRTAVVGIVDTGIDTAHIDIGKNIWRNPGETGRDNSGNDKRYNDIDDDSNGYVDDWYGWDFVGADGSSPDNSPLPGNKHGTHVAGIVAAIVDNLEGVAGTSVNVKLMPCKVGRDSPVSTSVENTANAILYAASNGANIINTSFGSPSQTFADLDIINTVIDLGVLIVAAAGNDNSDQAFYPAAYKSVLSVASTDAVDAKSFFSNYHSSVDVTAPGSRILSTVPLNQYDYQDGTSMSSPVAAGISAMVHIMDTTLTPAEIRATVKANTDNIDEENLEWVGKLGSGRVNALNAITFRNNRYAEVASYEVTDTDGDSVFLPGDSLILRLSVQNILTNLTNARIEVSTSPSTFTPILGNASAELGAMISGEIKPADTAITLLLPKNVGQNATLALLVTIYENDTIVGRDLVTATVNQSYRTMHANNITVTSNSVGNIGYNDYPENTQGNGFQIGDVKESLLFEGALIIGTGPDRISDVARGVVTSFRNYDYFASRIVELRDDSVVSGKRLVCSFSDSMAVDPVQVDVVQNIYERTEDSLKNAVFVVYNVTNNTSSTISNLHVSIFMDWDLGPAGADNGTGWDNENGMGVAQNVYKPSIPFIGASMISPLVLNFYAIDNRGSLYTPGIYDSFTDAEKWMMISGGLSRVNSSITDVSMMIGGGPFDLKPNETQQVAFIIGAGSDLADLKRTMKSAREAGKEMNIDVLDYTPLSIADNFLYIENGNSISPGGANMHFELRTGGSVVIGFVDLLGRPVGSQYSEESIPAGKYVRLVEVPNVATGVYFVRFASGSTVQYIPVQVVP
ncbi:MAG: S8 family serine peptidase [Ignavibacteria bacterium]|nr:S8 family serine peptidase [Ignavibacteria bacterium]